jgi:hypothetical protein
MKLRTYFVSIAVLSVCFFMANAKAAGQTVPEAKSYKTVLMMAERYRPSIQPGDTVIIQCRPFFTGEASRGGDSSNVQMLTSVVEGNNILLLCYAVASSENHFEEYENTIELVSGIINRRTGQRNTGSKQIWDSLGRLGYVSYKKPYIITTSTKFFSDLASKKLKANEIGTEPIIFQMAVEVVAFEQDSDLPLLIFKDPASLASLGR